MKRCLDEGTLQSYFDGELPIEMMESATVHLNSCVTCAAMAREFEQETALLTSALAAEFGAPVPTEQLRRRVDAAVADLHVPVVAEKRSFFGSLTSLFNFAPQQAGDMEIKPGQKFVSRYRFAVHDGPADREELYRLWNDYAHPPSVTDTEK